MLSKKEEIRQNKEALYKEVVNAGGRPAGKNMVHCPYHNDKTASAWIKQSKNGGYYMKCFTCNVALDIFDVRARNENKDVKEVLKEMCGVAQPIRQYYYKTIDELVASLDAIDIEEINPYTDPETNHIDLVTIRYWPRNGNRKSFTQAFQTDKGFVNKRPAGKLPLFNRVRLNDSDTIIYVEGEKCVRYLTKLGFTATTGSGGASNADAHDYSLLSGKTVLLWPDNDEPGCRYMEQVREHLLALEPAPTVYTVNLKELELPQGGDVADLIDRTYAEGGTDEDCKIQVELALAEAEEENKLGSLEELLDDMREGRYTNLPIPDMPILTNEAKMFLNKKIGLVFGAPGLGKSLLVSKLADDLALRNYKVARLQLEDELELHLLRSLAQQSGNSALASPDFHQKNPEISKKLYEENKRTLETIANTVISGESQDWDVDKLLQWCEDKLKQGIELLIIDPVSVIMTGKVWLTSHKFVWGLKKLLSQYPNARALLVAHPNDNGEVGGGKAYGRFCHTILTLNRFKSPKNVLIINQHGEQDTVRAESSIGIVKSRYGKGGGLELAMRLNPDTLCMEELGVIIMETDETIPSQPKARNLEAENRQEHEKLKA
jgi:hypothetical protein